MLPISPPSLYYKPCIDSAIEKIRNNRKGIIEEKSEANEDPDTSPNLKKVEISIIRAWKKSEELIRALKGIGGDRTRLESALTGAYWIWESTLSEYGLEHSSSVQDKIIYYLNVALSIVNQAKCRESEVNFIQIEFNWARTRVAGSQSEVDKSKSSNSILNTLGLDLTQESELRAESSGYLIGSLNCLRAQKSSKFNGRESENWLQVTPEIGRRSARVSFEGTTGLQTSSGRAMRYGEDNFSSVSAQDSAAHLQILPRVYMRILRIFISLLHLIIILFLIAILILIDQANFLAITPLSAALLILSSFNSLLSCVEVGANIRGIIDNSKALSPAKKIAENKFEISNLAFSICSGVAMAGVVSLHVFSLIHPEIAYSNVMFYINISLAILGGVYILYTVIREAITSYCTKDELNSKRSSVNEEIEVRLGENHHFVREYVEAASYLAEPDPGSLLSSPRGLAMRRRSQSAAASFRDRRAEGRNPNF